MENRVKRLYLLVLVFVAIVCCNTCLFGQNNPYKIDDELYSYYTKCIQNVKNKKVLTMSDTMVVMSKKKHDLKAQCLAMNLKGEYYYYNSDLDNLKKEISILGNFARTTPFKQYVFSLWNRLITYYIVHDRFDLALDEIRKYQKEALRLNDNYGIGNSFRKFAELYQIQANYDMALKEMGNAITYFRNNGKESDVYDIYASMGNIYLEKKDYKNAEIYFLKAVESCKVESVVGKYYLELANVNLEMSNLPKVKKYVEMLTLWEKKYQLPLAASQIENLFFANYYIETKEYPKAIERANMLKSELTKKLVLSRIYRNMGDYQKADFYQFSSYKLREKMMVESQQKILAEYTARFDNKRMNNEKNMLELKNTRLKVEQLRTHDRMLLFEKERNGLKLSNAQLEILNRGLALQRAKSETARQKSDARYQKSKALAAIQEAAANRKVTSILILLLIAVIMGFVSYIILRLRSSKRLKTEMNEVKKARNEAEIAREEAERANQLKTLFLQNMSHELRTPLNAIVGFSEMLADTSIPISDAEKAQFVGLVQSNSKLLTTLVNDVLDLSTLESGGYEPEIQEFSASNLCEQAVSMLINRVPVNVVLRFDKPSEDLMLKSDRTRVLQVLTNFLTNACKYTEKGSIVLTFDRQPSQVVFSVTDTGCGISAENSERIFDRFEKLNSFKQGNGLGLNICRSVAHLLHGEILLDTSYTGGSRFLFTLPSSVFVLN